jgi:hypothetical protein
MKPPTCRVCGKAEWNHVCQVAPPVRAAPGRPRLVAPPKAAKPTEPVEGTIAPPGECPYCDNRRVANARAAERHRQARKEMA